MADPLNATEFLRELFDVAVAAAQPARVLPNHLPEMPAGRTVVLGAGKASAGMAAALENHWHGPLSGLVVTQYGHGVPTRQVEVVEAAHPVPDAAGLRASRRILGLAQAAGPDDLVICLLSGGASALLNLPVDGISLQDKQLVNQLLLRCGAPIEEVNLVRKRLSAIKGGWLGAAIAPASATTLLISDVPGDVPSVIGSGPTVVDAGATTAAALAVLDRYALDLPDNVSAAVRSNTLPDRLPDNQQVRLIATPLMSLEAAAGHARNAGVMPLILGDALQGEARDLAGDMAAVVKRVMHRGAPVERPCVLLSGGETSVTLPRTARREDEAIGRGGRNTEFLLALAIALGDCPGVYALACDTDGIDGSGNNAGAVLDPTSMARAGEQGNDPEAHLQVHDAYGFFLAIGGLVTTGPTLTNVNDFRAIYLP